MEESSTINYRVQKLQSKFRQKVQRHGLFSSTCSLISHCLNSTMYQTAKNDVVWEAQEHLIPCALQCESKK